MALWKQQRHLAPRRLCLFGSPCQLGSQPAIVSCQTSRPQAARLPLAAPQPWGACRLVRRSCLRCHTLWPSTRRSCTRWAGLGTMLLPCQHCQRPRCPEHRGSVAQMGIGILSLLRQCTGRAALAAASETAAPSVAALRHLRPHHPAPHRGPLQGVPGLPLLLPRVPQQRQVPCTLRNGMRPHLAPCCPSGAGACCSSVETPAGGMSPGGSCIRTQACCFLLLCEGRESARAGCTAHAWLLFS